MNYIKYSDIKVIYKDSAGTSSDITSDITTQSQSATGNTYKVGAYMDANANAKGYFLKPAGESFPCVLNTSFYDSLGGIIPLVQSSSSSPVLNSGHTTSMDVYLKDILYSTDNQNWVPINSYTNLYSGIWSTKNPIEYEWLDSMDG